MVIRVLNQVSEKMHRLLAQGIAPALVILSEPDYTTLCRELSSLTQEADPGARYSTVWIEGYEMGLRVSESVEPLRVLGDALLPGWPAASDTPQAASEPPLEEGAPGVPFFFQLQPGRMDPAVQHLYGLREDRWYVAVHSVVDYNENRFLVRPQGMAVLLTHEEIVYKPAYSVN